MSLKNKQLVNEFELGERNAKQKELDLMVKLEALAKVNSTFTITINVIHVHNWFYHKVELRLKDSLEKVIHTE